MEGFKTRAEKAIGPLLLHFAETDTIHNLETNLFIPIDLPVAEEFVKTNDTAKLDEYLKMCGVFVDNDGGKSHILLEVRYTRGNDVICQEMTINHPGGSYKTPEFRKLVSKLRPDLSEEDVTDLKAFMDSNAKTINERYKQLPAKKRREIEYENHKVLQKYVRVCKYCKDFAVGLKKCGKCRAVHYCGRECQKNDWKNHKPNCK